MKNKKVGILLVCLAALLFYVLLGFVQETKSVASEYGCLQDQECAQVATTLNMSHLGIGIIVALFSLGVYMLIFSRDESALVKAIEQQKDSLLQEEKMKIIAALLTPDQQRVLQVIKEEEGITQSTLRIRANVPKATLSQILKFFEDKNMITREPKGKTYSIYLNKAI